MTTCDAFEVLAVTHSIHRSKFRIWVIRQL
jgi:hypothetical protein